VPYVGTLPKRRTISLAKYSEPLSSTLCIETLAANI
jgi:hypothetical protein